MGGNAHQLKLDQKTQILYSNEKSVDNRRWLPSYTWCDSEEGLSDLALRMRSGRYG